MFCEYAFQVFLSKTFFHIHALVISNNNLKNIKIIDSKHILKLIYLFGFLEKNPQIKTLLWMVLPEINYSFLVIYFIFFFFSENNMKESDKKKRSERSDLFERMMQPFYRMKIGE